MKTYFALSLLFLLSVLTQGQELENDEQLVTARIEFRDGEKKELPIKVKTFDRDGQTYVVEQGLQKGIHYWSKEDKEFKHVHQTDLEWVRFNLDDAYHAFRRIYYDPESGLNASGTFLFPVYIEGPMNLLLYEWFVRIDGVVERRFNWILEKQGQGQAGVLVIPRFRIKKALKDYFEDDPVLLDRVKKVKYKQDNINELVEFYNNVHKND